MGVSPISCDWKGLENLALTGRLRDDVDPIVGIGYMVAPDMVHLSENVVDWVWLPRADPTLFISGVAPGRQVVPLDWQVMVIMLDFSTPNGEGFTLSSREHCVREVCRVCEVRS